MFFIYGNGSSRIATKKLPDYVCSECEEKGSTSVVLSSEYAHLFWIPLFPQSTFGDSHCSYCGLVLPPHEMDDPLFDVYTQLDESAVKKPWWSYLGLILIGISILVIIIAIIYSLLNQS